MTTKKRKAIMACAMNLMDAYDDLANAEGEEEYNDATQEYNWRLSYLSDLTGLTRLFIESELHKRDECTYNLDWLRTLGVEI